VLRIIGIGCGEATSAIRGPASRRIAWSAIFSENVGDVNAALGIERATRVIGGGFEKTSDLALR
jgi:hypothetical protein